MQKGMGHPAPFVTPIVTFPMSYFARISLPIFGAESWSSLACISAPLFLSSPDPREDERPSPAQRDGVQSLPVAS
jgi:hypothetical protein